MTTDEIVLLEVERWFRCKLRGESTLFGFEERLFFALAEREILKPDDYTPRETAAPMGSLHPPTVAPLPTTRPPPSDIQHELLRLSRVEIVGHGDGLPRPENK